MSNYGMTNLIVLPNVLSKEARKWSLLDSKLSHRQALMKCPEENLSVVFKMGMTSLQTVNNLELFVDSLINFKVTFRITYY